MASAQHQALHGNNAIGWLTGLYQDLLGGAPDAAGFNGRLSALYAGTSPYQIALSFSRSAEREATFITADYLQFLGRLSDPVGMAGWLDNGGDRGNIAAGIVGSDEYYAAHGGNDSVATYEDILHRDPSTWELDAWFSYLGQVGA